eukprot:c37401_g1_i1 orf=439-606(+)
MGFLNIIFTNGIDPTSWQSNLLPLRHLQVLDHLERFLCLLKSSQIGQSLAFSSKK